MIENQDYVMYDAGMVMNSKQPMKQVDVCVVGTKNYVFYVPKKTVGLYYLFNSIKTHQFFDGVSIEDGIKKLIAQSETAEDLEKSMIALVEDDEKCVHEIKLQKSFKFRGFLGKHTLRMSTGGLNWSSVSPMGKGKSKAMRTFYGQ
ncbi:MAG: hypothetical protein V4622_02490 [Bacteroidota bacterium]